MACCCSDSCCCSRASAEVAAARHGGFRGVWRRSPHPGPARLLTPRWERRVRPPGSGEGRSARRSYQRPLATVPRRLANMLSKILPKRPKPLSHRQVVQLSLLDAWLDVATDRFPATVARLATQFLRAQATLDLMQYREGRRATANPAVVADIPDLRGTSYQLELRRIQPMDREEEFRMARRHEFLRALVEKALLAAGFDAAGAEACLRRPAREAVLALRDLAGSRRVDRPWLEQMLGQYEELRNLYVEGALHIVLSTVNRYRGLGVDTADLIQEGNASLFQAIDGFDWRRDVRFRTYAQYWVHQAVLKMLYNSSRTVRVPIWVQKVLGKIRRAQEAGRREGRNLTPAEIGARIGLPAERVEWVLATRRYAVSIDAETEPGEGGSLAQALPDTSLVPIPEAIPPGDLREALAEAMADLPDREQRILRRRFGLDGGEPQTLGEIAVDLGITAERVRQLQNAAIGRIQKPPKLRRLQAFVE
ncbi:MAG: sigma-70 family RNA polymerase sigma factor [Planctomycetes bacterium]|nr:sigma-70 family RNA polymerase sigma factor [Planctomycetota bacterium]